jgi:hypothetical protein
MPPPNIVGTSPAGKPFFVGYGLIANEQKELYEFILSYLQSVYRQLSIGIEAQKTVITERRRR